MNAQGAVAEFDGRNISPFAEAELEANDLLLEARNWAEKGYRIPDANQAQAIETLFDGVGSLIKRFNDMEAGEVEPVLAEEERIRAPYRVWTFKGKTRPKGKLISAKEVLGAILTDWRTREQARKDAEKAAAEAEARAIEEEQRKAEEEARTGDLAAAERAAELEADLSAASDAAKRMAKAAKAPAGLRTIYRAELVDQRAAMLHYMHAEPQAFLDLIQNLADRDVRSPATRQIPGFKTIEEKVAL